MQIKSDYFSASFISFVIHATIILYLTDFFYFEKQQRPVLSKPVNVNLLFKEEVEIQSNQQEAKVEQAANPEILYQIDNKIHLLPAGTTHEVMMVQYWT